MWGCACDKCKRSKRNFCFTRQLLSYAWQAKLDHNARERARFGGTSHKTLYGAWGSSYYYKTLHKQTMIPGIVFASFSLLISKWVRCISGDKPASFCALSHKTSAQMGEKTQHRSTQKTLKNFGRGEKNCGKGLSTVKREDAICINLIPLSEHLEWQKNA